LAPQLEENIGAGFDGRKISASKKVLALNPIAQVATATIQVGTCDPIEIGILVVSSCQR
jgi:hypothetical protein